MSFTLSTGHIRLLFGCIFGESPKKKDFPSFKKIYMQRNSDYPDAKQMYISSAVEVKVCFWENICMNGKLSFHEGRSMSTVPIDRGLVLHPLS